MKNFQELKICLYLPFKYQNTFNNVMFKWFNFELYSRWVPLGVIHLRLRPRWITPSEICLIFHILRKPNSLTALLFIQSNSQLKNIAKTCSPASMLSSSSTVSVMHVQVCPAQQIFSKQQMSPSELSSCCFCCIFSYYFSQFQPQFLLLKRVKCPPFLFSKPKQLNLVLKVFSVNGALTCTGLHF